MDHDERPHESGDGHGTRRPQLLALSVLFPVALLALSLLISSGNALGSTNVLKNGGFEDGTSYWYPSYGITFTTSTLHVRSGDGAASLVRDDTIGEIWILQDMSVVPGATYTLTGWVYQNEPNVDQACLRIRWRGSDWLDTEQWCAPGQADYYRPFTSEPVMAPPDAITARVLALADIGESGMQEPVYFDDLSFTSSLDPTPAPAGTPFHVPLVLKHYPL